MYFMIQERVSSPLKTKYKQRLLYWSRGGKIRHPQYPHQWTDSFWLQKKMVVHSIMTLFNHDVAAGKTLDKISPDSIKMSSAKWSKYLFSPLLATAWDLTARHWQQWKQGVGGGGTEPSITGQNTADNDMVKFHVMPTYLFRWTCLRPFTPRNIFLLVLLFSNKCFFIVFFKHLPFPQSASGVVSF